jgi:hypothetical protein
MYASVRHGGARGRIYKKPVGLTAVGLKNATFALERCMYLVQGGNIVAVKKRRGFSGAGCIVFYV